MLGIRYALGLFLVFLMCVFLLTLVFFSDVPPYHPRYGRNCPSYSYEVYGGEVEAAVPDLILATRRKKLISVKALYSGIDRGDESFFRCYIAV